MMIDDRFRVAATFVLVLLAMLATAGAALAAPSFDVRLAEQHIREALANHPPAFALNLDGTTQTAAVAALERAGAVGDVSRFEKCSGQYERMRLTERGAELVASNAWPVTYNVLTVPLGRFEYVAHSLRLVMDQRGAPAALSFQFRFVGNRNLTPLLRIAPASQWPLRSPIDMSLTAADAGKTLTYRSRLDAAGGVDQAERAFGSRVIAGMCTYDRGSLVRRGPVGRASTSVERTATASPAPTPRPRPTLRSSDTGAMILANLDYDMPHVTIALRCGSRSAVTAALERARILTQNTATTHCPGGPLRALQLTEHGLEIASERGWDVHSDYFLIPVGRLVYVARSAAVENGESRSPSLSYAFRFEGNGNVAFLRSIAPASQWCVSAFPPPPSLSLADVGEVRSRNVLMVHDEKNEWTLLNTWFAPSAKC